jgi:hypothetical protein
MIAREYRFPRVSVIFGLVFPSFLLIYLIASRLIAEKCHLELKEEKAEEELITL